MRKTFKLFCAAAIAALTVSSCGKIWDEFDSVHGQLDSIEARLDSLETSLNGQVATINTTLGALAKADEKLAADIAALVKDAEATKALLEKLDAADGTINGKIDDLTAALAKFEDANEKALAEIVAKIAVVKVEKNKAGNVVLTFADGSTLEVAAADPYANNTGLVTVVDGKWAVVGADGKTTVLDAEVHPDTKLDFKVEENTLFVSYDGGKTWEKTDVVVNDETTINIVEDFKYTEGDAFVTITVGGKEYQLPLYEADNSSLTFGRTEAFFMYGASKKMELQAEDIVEYYVMSKPDGWKASMEETTLTVTAPAKALIEMGAAELEGEVLIHATAATGACKVVKLDVATGEAMKLSYSEGNINIFTAFTSEQTNFWGETYYDFVPLYLGVTPLDEYLTYGSFEAFIASQDSEKSLGNIISIAASNGYIDNSWYVEGEFEEIRTSIPLAELVKYYNEVLAEEAPLDYDEKEVYVLWLLPQGSSEDNPYFYDAAIFTFTGTKIDFVAGESVYNNVTFAADFIGADGYAVGAFSKSMFDSWVDPEIDPDYTHEDALFEYLVGSWQPGPFGKFTSGNKTAMGDIYPSGAQTVKLADVMLSDPMAGVSGDVAPNTEYFVWVLPYYNDKPAADYTLEDLELYTCKTAALVKNASVNATVSIVPGFESVKYTITPVADGNFQYDIYPVEEYKEAYYKDDALVESELLESFSYSYPYEETLTENQTWNIKTGVDYVLVTYSTANGYYSIAEYEFTPIECEVPVNKQWIIDPKTNTDWAENVEPYRGLLDFGVNTTGTFSLSVSQEDAFPDEPEAEGLWMPYIQFEISKVIPTDETSGVIKLSKYDDWFDEYTYVDIPYSDLTEDTCKFDLSNLCGITVTGTLSDETIEIMEGGIAM